MNKASIVWTIEKLVSKGKYTYARVNPAHPRQTKTGYVLAHRIVVENFLNRLLLEDEIVHHKNKNKKDNRIENLAVMKLGEHSRLHASTGRAKVILTCPFCKEKFEREPRKTNLVNKRNLRTFCSRSCRARFYAPVV